MKVLHSALMSGDELGIMNQMAWEQEVAQSLGLKWDTRLYCPASSALSGPSLIKSHLSSNDEKSKILGKLIFWFKFRIEYYRWLAVQSENYDVILLRHSKYDPFRPGFIKKSGTPVFTVHHTLELAEIVQNGGLAAKLKAAVEGILGARSIGYSKGIIGVTREIVKYEINRIDNAKIPAYVYPNGIFLDNKSVSEVSDKRTSDVPELLFVASHFSSWHGLDRLLNTLDSTEREFILHVVGRVSDSDKLLALSDSRVVFHGLCAKEEIVRLSERAWVGLASFALDRNSMQEACTLKVRDYLSQGIPVYADYKDVFPDDFVGFRKGPPEICKILDYAIETRQLEKKVVAESAIPFISKKRLVGQLSNWLVNTLK